MATLNASSHALQVKEYRTDLIGESMVVTLLSTNARAPSPNSKTSEIILFNYK